MSDEVPVFRAARTSDAPYIADLMIQSAPVLNHYVFGKELHRVITEAFRSNRGIWAAKHAYIIAVGEQVAAVVTCYPTRNAPAIVWDGVKFIYSLVGFIEGSKILMRIFRTAPLYHPFLKKSAYIANVASHPDFRGRGLASLLMRSVENLRDGSVVRRFELDVELDNTPARKLYEKLGWTVRNMRLPTSRLPGVVRMVKEFPSENG